MPDTDALNYPYIHIRDVDWLKRTLLMFPHVVRMTPRNGAPNDSDEIREFCRVDGRRGPLLRSARLFDDEIDDAQDALIRRIEADLRRDPAFVDKFKRRARAASREDRGFQIHESKVAFRLTQFLKQHDLAWEPRMPDGWAYFEMHPQLGAAVMATLAHACARNEGLEVVTEFPDVHGQVVGHQANTDVYDSIMHPAPPDVSPATEAFQVLVYLRCDVSDVTPEDIVALHKDYDALRAIRQAIEEISERVPKLKSRHLRQEYLNDVVHETFKRWQADKANFPNTLRELGMGAPNQVGKLLERFAEKAAGPTVGGAIIGGLTNSVVFSTVAGFGVGLLNYTVGTWQTLRRGEKKSPFRYLSQMEKRGVSFAIGT